MTVYFVLFLAHIYINKLDFFLFDSHVIDMPAPCENLSPEIAIYMSWRWFENIYIYDNDVQISY